MDLGSRVTDTATRLRSSVPDFYGGEIQIEQLPNGNLDISLISAQGTSTAVAFTPEDVFEIVAVLDAAQSTARPQTPEPEQEGH